jgi:uncharacterized protein (DUF305 family)
MQTKSLLYGLIGFFIGGFLVSVAATTFDKPKPAEPTINSAATMTMEDMSAALHGKTGDNYDKAFIEGMIVHHEGAIDMARQSATNAKHEEIKQLSRDIIAAQEKEIDLMKQWQAAWSYSSSAPAEHPTH